MADPATSRFGIVLPDSLRTDAADVPLYDRNIGQAVEALGAIYGQGTLATRPVSTPANPGIAGRFYMATDSSPHILYYDYGTGWDTVGYIADGSVGTTQLADLAVTTGKLADLAVTTAKLNDLAVTAAKIADGTITAVKLANALKPSTGAGAATEALRALGTAAGTAAAGTHGSQHALAGADPLPANSVGASQIQDGTVGAAEIADGSVGTAELANSAVTRAKIASDLIGNAGYHIEHGAVASGSIGAGGFVDVAAGFSFSAAPHVVALPTTDASGISPDFSLQSVSTVQATIRVYNRGSGSSSFTVHWIAIGPS